MESNKGNIKLSIIIPVKDNKDLTLVCLDTLEKYTLTDHEVILVDDGSAADIRESFGGRVGHYIRNDVSVGWPKAINQGLSVAQGEYVVFANNDICFTPGWDEKMLSCFTNNPNLGVLGPVSSKVDGKQNVDFNNVNIVYESAESIIFFCVMISRRCLDIVGNLDEIFGLGGGDDADFCRRARMRNFEVGICREVFIYHYGSATFRNEFKNNIPLSQEFARSRMEILNNKYGMYKPLVMICIPNLGTIRPELVQRLLFWAKTSSCRVHIYMPSGMLPLDNARSHCLNKFLELSNHPDDRLWFIDEDIIPPPEGLDILLKHNVDIVGLLCFMLKPDDRGFLPPVPVALRYNEEKKYIVYFNGKGLTEVDALGGGCIMVKRKVFEAIGGRCYEFFYYPDGTLNLVGDFDFCQKAQKTGFKIYVDFDVLCGHIKDVDLLSINNMMVKLSGEKKNV